MNRVEFQIKTPPFKVMKYLTKALIKSILKVKLS